MCCVVNVNELNVYQMDFKLISQREDWGLFGSACVFYQKDFSLLKLGVGEKLHVCLHSLWFHVKMLI